MSNLGWLIFGYFAFFCVASLLCIIFMHMFYRVMKGIYQFAANLLSYIRTKYYWNRSTSDLAIAKSKRVNFFLKHSVLRYAWLPSWFRNATHYNTLHRNSAGTPPALADLRACGKIQDGSKLVAERRRHAAGCRELLLYLFATFLSNGVRCVALRTESSRADGNYALDRKRRIW